MSNGTERILSDRLILRKLIPSDAQMMFNNWANDPNVTKFLTWKHHSSIEVTKNGLLKRQEKYENKNYYDWGIELKDDHNLIGTITVVEQLIDKKCMVVGYCIGKSWWGNGYTTEALKIVIKYLFINTYVKRIEASHDTRNINSGKVMIKSGMFYEGVLRKRGLNNIGICDEAMYSILRSDYFKKRGIS